MTIRERLENEEKQRLSSFASLSACSAGRDCPISPCDLRTCYQRDRDRIIHCKSFRRLKYKTQVFLSPKGDHYRTRLTHTLEVAQVARTLARCLRLNEDLTEAIALGHDLGHTPFGHIGENTLNQLIPGGFRHNEQSLRMVERLEKEGEGLNLCKETRNGILCHSGEAEPSTLEGWCVRRADRIAYISHDIDDAIRGGILQEFELPKHCVQVLGATHGERINTMIADVVSVSMDQNYVRMSENVRNASEELRDFMFTYVYHDEWRKKEESRCDYVVRALFEHFCQHPEQLPGEYLEIFYVDGAERAVCDFVAGMTDRYAIATFQSLFIPNAFAKY
ncbi:MAG: deoxyguanosinetriphosphate triphosphohydrolase [Eubacteriales bacterium]|nr:deoxyguanosinetriphosphate triphosphohydrolase [Eubacteriales bacterium]